MVKPTKDHWACFFLPTSSLAFLPSQPCARIHLPCFLDLLFLILSILVSSPGL